MAGAFVLQQILYSYLTIINNKLNEIDRNYLNDITTTLSLTYYYVILFHLIKQNYKVIFANHSIYLCY